MHRPLQRKFSNTELRKFKLEQVDKNSSTRHGKMQSEFHMDPNTQMDKGQANSIEQTKIQNCRYSPLKSMSGPRVQNVQNSNCDSASNASKLNTMENGKCKLSSRRSVKATTGKMQNLLRSNSRPEDQQTYRLTMCRIIAATTHEMVN